MAQTVASTCPTALFAAYPAARTAGKKITLINARDGVRTVVQITGLLAILVPGRPATEPGRLGRLGPFRCVRSGQRDQTVAIVVATSSTSSRARKPVRPYRGARRWPLTECANAPQQAA
jgi:hypothetical protein